MDIRKNSGGVNTSPAKTGFLIIVFICFVLGAYICFRTGFDTELFKLSKLNGLIFPFIPLLMAFIFSASLLGIAFLPLISACMGFLSFAEAGKLISAYLDGAVLNIIGLSVLFFSIPAFFILAVNGMKASGILISAMCGSGSSVKTAFKREIVPMIIIFSAAALAAYGIIG